MWIRLAYGTEKCWITVSMGLALVCNTKMVYKVLNLSVTKCTKGHIRISVITEPYCYLWTCKSKGCQVVEFVIFVYSEKNTYMEDGDNVTVRQPDQIEDDRNSLCT
jgi:hypothetical protein